MLINMSTPSIFINLTSLIAWVLNESYKNESLGVYAELSGAWNREIHPRALDTKGITCRGVIKRLPERTHTLTRRSGGSGCPSDGEMTLAAERNDNVTTEWSFATCESAGWSRVNPIGGAGWGLPRKREELRAAPSIKTSLALLLR